MTNQKQGKRFEQQVEALANELRPDLVIKRIERSQFDTIYDIEFHDFPHLKVDCKSTINFYSFLDLKKLLENCKKKYCSDPGDVPVIIFGERKGKHRITKNNIGVALRHKGSVIIMPIDHWLDSLQVK